MHKIYALKDMLVDELEKYGDKKDLSPGDLAIVDTLAHATKNLCKVIEDAEGEEGASGRYMPSMYYGDDGRMMGGSRRSYAGRRNARRDSMGRYSSEDYSRAADDVIDQLEGMMESAPDERSRTKIRELIHEMKKV